MFAYPLQSKDSIGVAWKLLELLLTFGVRMSIRTDVGGSSRLRLSPICASGRECRSIAGQLIILTSKGP